MSHMCRVVTCTNRAVCGLALDSGAEWCEAHDPVALDEGRVARGELTDAEVDKLADLFRDFEDCAGWSDEADVAARKWHEAAVHAAPKMLAEILAVRMRVRKK